MNLISLCINNIAFSIGDLDIAWYGIIVTSGIVVAFLFFLFFSKKQGLDEDYQLESFLWIVILAVLFARIFYVVPRIGDEYTTFAEMIDIRSGGLTIVGGIFGGILGILLVTITNKKYHFAQLSDCVAFPLLLGQIIGRWGNFVNQELFGLPITNPTFQHFPFAVYIEQPWVHYPGYEAGWYCALFFYEGVINAIGLIVGYILYRKYKDKIKPMTLTLGYLTWYGLVRGTLEFLKIDNAKIGNTNIGSIQVISYVMACVGIILLILLYTNKISFISSKWDKIIEEKRAKILAKEAAKATEKQTNNLETKAEDINESESKNVDGNDIASRD